MLSCLIPPWVALLALVLSCLGRAGFLLGLRPQVFVFRGSSVPCAGFYMMVGVLVWGWVRKGVGGAARRVAGFTWGWV